jgi:dTDP-4-amino-4,6-dideoxygalactose transaminase
LRAIKTSSDDRILLPAYIGWSRKEGSGVFDPISELGLEACFYRIGKDLSIDVDHLSHQLTVCHPRLLVVIHYFGYPDRNLPEVIQLADRHGVPVFEDSAHALYSDLIGGVCGRFGKASVVSLHKMLPVADGGMLILNGSDSDTTCPIVSRMDACEGRALDLLNYDLYEIAATRRRNTIELARALEPIRGRIDPLYSRLPKGVVPQTLPAIVNGFPRDQIYFRMNEEGYGVVSLYHTLINQISVSEFPDSCWLSRNIVNLPVHQDMSLEQIVGMAKTLAKLIEEPPRC